MKLAVAVLFLCGVMHAQVPAWLCTADSKTEMQSIHDQTAKDNSEHGFRVDSDGVFFTFGASTANDSKGDQMSIQATRGKTVAVVHTHPDGYIQTPSPRDREIARKYGIPVVVLGMRAETITAAMPEGGVVWWSYFWHDKITSCKAKK
jgi:proteasome lid subunit RPN8/RPN11